MNPYGIEVYHSKKLPLHFWAIVAIGVVGAVVIYLTR